MLTIHVLTYTVTLVRVNAKVGINLVYWEKGDKVVNQNEGMG